MYIIIQAVWRGNHDIDTCILLYGQYGEFNHDIDTCILLYGQYGEFNHDIDTCILLYGQYGEVTMTLIHVYYYTGSMAR